MIGKTKKEIVNLCHDPSFTLIKEGIDESHGIQNVAWKKICVEHRETV